MYGLVNKGIRDLVRARFGDARWDRIASAAGVTDAHFTTMSPYPDEVTYGLVGATSAELGLTPAQVLEEFGAFWVQYTGQEGFGALFAMAGHSVEEVLRNLDALHGRIGHTFTGFRMPEFTCERLPGGELRLIYRSTRDGLAPMVRGLLRGLGAHFGTPVDVRHTVARDGGAPHDEFVLRVAPRAAAEAGAS